MSEDIIPDSDHEGEVNKTIPLFRDRRRGRQLWTCLASQTIQTMLLVSTLLLIKKPKNMHHEIDVRITYPMIAAARMSQTTPTVGDICILYSLIFMFQEKKTPFC